jgi:hypothetical protein
MTDGDEIAAEVNNIFGQNWFFQTEEEKLKGIKLRGLMETGCGKGFDKMSEEMNIPEDVSQRVRSGLLTKEFDTLCLEESKSLSKYVPTLEEFKAHIDHLNPRSAGGPSGLTYLLVQLWPDEIKDKIYEELKRGWVDKSPSKLWSMKLLQTIPKKKEDPGLQDLRPLMLLEVTRKIWVGLIMIRIGDFWKK